MRTLIARLTRLSPVFPGLAVQALLIVNVCAAPATEWRSAEFNCRLNLPDGWRQLKAPNEQVNLLAQSGDGTRIITLLVSAALLRGPFNKQEGIQGVKAEISAQGGSITSEREFTLGGMPACELVALVPQQGRQLAMKALYVWADGRVYALSGMGAAADSAQDPEINACLASFAFVRPPQGPALPEAGSGYSVFEESKLITTVLLWAAATFGVVYLIRRIIRKSKRPAG
jgi:hypothetical protein